MTDPTFPRDVVSTIGDRCRRCYNCVRSCPAKAIRVMGGQASVISERCIGCGNCIRVCAQHAKQVQSAVEGVRQILSSDGMKVALLAPSYPAALDDADAGQVVAAVRALGFDQVLEVAFGAEMVAAEYADLLRDAPATPLISTACPALVSYVEKHMPELVPNLAPIVSPMIAIARAVKQHYCPGARVVFIGPCVAKKAEILDPPVAEAVDAAMTYHGLQEMIGAAGLQLSDLTPSLADEPLPHYGGLFPVSGGLLKTAAIQADIADDAILIVEGPDRCLAALRSLQQGDTSVRFLDALFCEGCIAGPAYPGDLSLMARKERVTAHVRELSQWQERLGPALEEVRAIDVRRSFEVHDMRRPVPSETEVRDVLARTNKHGPPDELNCGACGYPTCRDKAIAVCQGLAEPEMCLPYLIDQLEVNVQRLSRSKEAIEKAREHAVRAQQLASMGKLAADIAQEISAPLSNLVVYAQLLRDNLPEDEGHREEVASIVAEALHCRSILSGLQGFGRQREPQWEKATVREIVDRALAEIGPRLQEAGVELVLDLPTDLPPLVADPAQLAQVLVNLLTNSLEAIAGEGRVELSAHSPEDGQSIEITVRDDGCGIDPEILSRVCQPFVTTKSSARTAGLGLAVVHGIVQAHHGEMQIASAPGEGTTVSLRLPADVTRDPSSAAVKVLLVDDDPDFLEQHRMVLSEMGFEVVSAERYDEALEVADREIPDAFVLDLMMERPDTGARLARALRRDPRFRRSPIVLLTSVVQETGFEFQRNPQEVLEWMRADAWFDKPAPAAQLASTLRRLLVREEEGRTADPA